MLELGVGQGSAKLDGIWEGSAVLELEVGQRTVKLDGGGRRADVLDRQFGGGGLGGAGAFLFLRLDFDRFIVSGGAEGA